MAWIEINDCAIRYEFRKAHGPTFVLMHEMGGTLESWDATISHFPDSIQILRYDQRGFGLSEKIIGDTSIDQHIQDLDVLLDKLGIDTPVVLAGVAVGAGISIGFAARFPNRVKHLVAFAPACGIAAEKQANAVAKAADIAFKGVRSAAEAIFELAFPPALQTNDQAYQDYRCAWLASDSRSLGAIYKMLATMDLSEALLGLSGSVVFVGGAFDVLRPPEEIERLGRLAPTAETVIVPSGHFMQVHSPRYVANLLLKLVNNGANAQTISNEFLSHTENRIGASEHAA